MTDVRKCSRCGTALTVYAAERLCPKCLLGSALWPVRESLASMDETALGAVAGTGESSQAELSPLSSSRFGEYELHAEVGRGGMGVVYKARQISLNRVVALKMIQAQRLASAGLVQRFHLEAQAAARLHHPNIVAIHEVGEQAGQHFFSMDYIEGKSLAEVIPELRFTIYDLRRGARWVKIIAEAIHYAHQHGILHRDLKPSNILIDHDDEPHLTDFGLAKRLEEESTLTLSGEVLGSPSYMAPEQAAGKSICGAAADIYSLGAVLFELLTGRPPFVGASAVETLQQTLQGEPIPPRALKPSIPPDLETICLKCLEKEAARRYRTAREVADELERFLRDEPIRARPVGSVERTWRWTRRNPVVAGLSVAILVLLLVVAIGSLMAALRIQKEREVAEARSYSSDMNLVQQALEVNNVGRAERLLNRHRPAGKSESPIGLPPNPKYEMGRRGWEWRYLWQQCQSQALFSLCRKSNSIISLAVSSDGKWLAIGEKGEGRLSIWDLQTRAEIARLTAGQNAVHAAFSPAEALLAFSVETGLQSSNRTDSVRLWDVHSRRIVAELPLGAWCRGLAFSNDGQTLITSTLPPENRFSLWKVPEGKKLASYRAVRTPSSGVRFAATRDLRLAAHVVKDRIRVINLASGQEQWTTVTADEEVSALTFSPDGRILATGAKFESTIHLWDADSGKDLGRLEGHSAYVMDLLFWPDGSKLASASADQTIRLWDITKMQPWHTLRGHRHEVWRLALLPDNKTLVSGCKDGSVCVWDTTKDPGERAVSALPVTVRAWGFAADGQSVLAFDNKDRVAQWQGAGFEDQQHLIDLGSGILQACISDDGRWIAGGYSNGIIRVWDLPQRSLWREFQAAPGPIRPWHISAQRDTLIIAGDSNHTHHEWDLSTGQKKRSWQGARNWTRGVLSPERNWCFTLGIGGVTSLRNLATGREVDLNLDGLEPWNASFSPDGRLFALASTLGFFKLWETDTFQEVATVGGFLLGVHSVTFSLDGKRLAAGSNAKEAIKIWDTGSQQELITLKGRGAMFSSCAFSPDGNVLGALNSGGVLHLWRAPSWEEIAAAEKETAR
ncbi:MAG: serine/threonine protein kinase [Verrucomicrobiales bacterium]|nr:serine/threonine protein kinase [Verrucomicrobiales bacterium]